MGILIKLRNILLFYSLIILPNSLIAQENIINAFKESIILENSGQYTEAIKLLENVYDDDSYELNIRIGWLNYLAGQLDKSIDFYNKAIVLKPYAIEPKFGLAYPLSAQAEWDEITLLYKDILEVDPQNTVANYRLGLIYYNMGHYEKAELYLNKVVNLYPFDYDSTLLLAWNKLALQKTREAEVLFNKVLLNSSDDESAIEGLKLIK